MNPRGIFFVLLAGLSVMAVVLLTRSFLQGAVADAQRQAPVAQAEKSSVRILVAKRDLKIGTLLKPQDYEFRPWPKDGVVDGHIRKQATAKALAGQVVRFPLAKGEPMAATKLVAPGSQGFLAAALSPGMRAATIQVSPTAGVGGFIFPGDRVDVILTHSVGTGSGVAETVLQNVRVLGLDQRSAKDEQAARLAKTVTLEVTPKMAEKVAILPKLGSLTLILRSLAVADGRDGQDVDAPPIGRATSHTYGAEVSSLLENPGQEKNLGQVRVARGNAVSVMEFKSRKADSDGQGETE